ncbi:GNAT family N-acetyltransferase [Paenisporosarcina sp. OV554]|uniref:GNAT family N-acetyltransferase n=1 Tax=Paenisporosarcina sp. OV554 TaxID=2135694 RepID=UPI000D34BD27|nr:GNAT family N-acetyltransferase [Paenisporosarcina sp. OV554]PUB11431.1 acetyltransferase (GNAT) family protein [Paenisporosarcina sp. OV554]
MSKKGNFKFFPFDIIKGEEIDLIIEQKIPENKVKGFVPTYCYAINLTGTKLTIGTIDLRIGNNTLTYYGGHIGYGIDKKHRGHHYAAKACKLLGKVALAHGMDELIITCNPENIASQKTCIRIGAELIEIVDLPTDTDMYLEGERQKCIYKWRIFS